MNTSNRALTEAAGRILRFGKRTPVAYMPEPEMDEDVYMWL